MVANSKLPLLLCGAVKQICNHETKNLHPQMTAFISYVLIYFFAIKSLVYFDVLKVYVQIYYIYISIYNIYTLAAPQKECLLHDVYKS